MSDAERREVTTAFRRVEIERVGPGGRLDAVDRAATEEPLEVRIEDEPFAVIMRTPGADRELVAGFLAAEQVIRRGSDLASLETGPGRGHAMDNVARVSLVPAARRGLARLLDERRNVPQNSSCGLCGRRTILSLRASVPPVESGSTIAPAIIAALPDRLRAGQRVFDETGGLHAAGLFDGAGRLLALHEDVGRHNAVDKIVGAALLDGRLPLAGHLLFVSGRTSFEIVQKAWLAGVPLVAAVSAPSTLAVDLAREAGITLVGFVRGATFNIYSHGVRIAGGADDRANRAAVPAADAASN